MALSEIDRRLLQRCLGRQEGAWKDFVDRFLGLFVHVVQHTAESRSIRLSEAERDDLCADILLALVRDDFAALRHFRGQSSLATYLTVIARRVAVKELLRTKNAARLTELVADGPADAASPEQPLEDREEVERLMATLDERDAEVVRLYHLEGKTYDEVSDIMGLSVNSIGPILSRAREKLRELATRPATS